jgi:hypothetical protein
MKRYEKYLQNLLGELQGRDRLEGWGRCGGNIKMELESGRGERWTEYWPVKRHVTTEEKKGGKGGEEEY